MTEATATITKYKTVGWRLAIEVVECVRETAQSVWVRRKSWGGEVESREAKSCDGHQYHDTWEAAHAFLMERETANVESLRMQLEQAKGRLGTVKGMKCPGIA